MFLIPLSDPRTTRALVPTWLIPPYRSRGNAPEGDGEFVSPPEGARDPKASAGVNGGRPADPNLSEGMPEG